MRESTLYRQSPTNAGLAAPGCQHAADVAVGGDPLGVLFQRFEASRFRLVIVICRRLPMSWVFERSLNDGCDPGFYVVEVCSILRMLLSSSSCCRHCLVSSCLCFGLIIIIIMSDYW